MFESYLQLECQSEQIICHKKIIKLYNLSDNTVPSNARESYKIQYLRPGFTANKNRLHCLIQPTC